MAAGERTAAGLLVLAERTINAGCTGSERAVRGRLMVAGSTYIEERVTQGQKSRGREQSRSQGSKREKGLWATAAVSVRRRQQLHGVRLP